MKKTRYTETRIIKILREVEGGRLVKGVCRNMVSQMQRITTGGPSTVR